MFCDVVGPTAPRTRATRATFSSASSKRAAELGYTFYIGPELEYYYFMNDDGPNSWTTAATST